MAIYPLQVKIFLPKIGYGGPKGLTSTPYKWSYMCVNKKGYLPPCGVTRQRADRQSLAREIFNIIVWKLTQFLVTCRAS